MNGEATDISLASYSSHGLSCRITAATTDIVYISGVYARRDCSMSRGNVYHEVSIRNGP